MISSLINFTLPISARMDRIIISVTFRIIRRAMLTILILITSHDYRLIKALVTQYQRLHLLRYRTRNLVYDKNFTVFYDRLSGWVYVSFDVCDKVVMTFRHLSISCHATEIRTIVLF